VGTPPTHHSVGIGVMRTDALSVGEGRHVCTEEWHPFEALPAELLDVVLCCCDAPALCAITSVSQRLRTAAGNPALWEMQFERRFRRVIPLFAHLPWSPLPEGENFKTFYFKFERTWMLLAAQQGLCILKIDGHVYDVTEFVEEHPGEPYLLSAAAGTDASEPFEYVQHSNHARRVLRSFARPDLDLEPEVGPSMGHPSTITPAKGGTWTAWAVSWARELRTHSFANLRIWLEGTLNASDDTAASTRHAQCIALLSRS